MTDEEKLEKKRAQNRERVRRFNERMKEQGLIRRDIYMTDEEARIVKKVLSLARKRGLFKEASE